MKLRFIDYKQLFENMDKYKNFKERFENHWTGIAHILQQNAGTPLEEKKEFFILDPSKSFNLRSFEDKLSFVESYKLPKTFQTISWVNKRYFIPKSYEIQKVD